MLASMYYKRSSKFEDKANWIEIEYGNLVVEFQGDTNLGRFLPQSEQIQRKLGYFFKWNNAELTKIGPIFT